MLILPENIIIMKIGPHSNMTLNEIIESKQEEELFNGVHYWGYSGVFCQPKPTQEFCKKCSWGTNDTPSLVLIETKSPYKSSIGKINKYSSNGFQFTEFKNPVQLQGAEFSFVTKNLRIVENFPLNIYNVVSGKNHGKPLLEHLRFRVNKSFATLSNDDSRFQGMEKTTTVLMADFVEPYAIWLRK